MRNLRLIPRSPALITTVAVVAALLTLVGLLIPKPEVDVEGPDFQVAIDTAVSVIALLAASLLFGRFRDTQDLDDLLLVAAFLVLLLANLSFSTIPSLAGVFDEDFPTWASTGGRLAGSLLLAIAAFWPPRRVANAGRAMAIALGGAVGVLAATGIAVGLAGGILPPGVRLDPSAPGVGLVASPALLAAQLISAVVLAAAAGGFARRALRGGDQLMHWIAATVLLAAFSRLNYFLFPSIYGDWVTLGDAFRAGAYILLLIGALAEIGVYRRQAAEAAQAEERERIARDLHDGLAQDLAFVAGRLRDLAGRPELEGRRDRALMTMLSSAAQRALDESRVAVSALASPLAAPLPQAIEHSAEEVAAREGGRVLVETEPGLEVSPEAKQAMLRIVREAVANAIRHGESNTVEVRLVADDGLLLEVKDNGMGFETGRAGGLGLETMRQRAAGCGGKAKIVSKPGDGTVVSVHLPPTEVGGRAGQGPRAREDASAKHGGESPRAFNH